MQAKTGDVGQIAPLFDLYRVFYEQESNIEAAHDFLNQRLTNEESIILMATWEGLSVGFTQLYTTYSSVSMNTLLILNDFFVLKEYRGKGIGEALLEAAKKICVTKNYKGLALETAIDNPAQKLYEKLDWKKDTDYLHYFWSNPALNS